MYTFFPRQKEPAGLLKAEAQLPLALWPFGALSPPDPSLPLLPTNMLSNILEQQQGPEPVKAAEKAEVVPALGSGRQVLLHRLSFPLCQWLPAICHLSVKTSKHLLKSFVSGHLG